MVIISAIRIYTSIISLSIPYVSLVVLESVFNHEELGWIDDKVTTMFTIVLQEYVLTNYTTKENKVPSIFLWSFTNFNIQPYEFDDLNFHASGINTVQNNYMYYQVQQGKM